jgi:MFS family permease
MSPQTPPARKRITLLALCLAAFIISLDVTIVNVALPALVRQTGATTTDLQWVVDAYNLVFAALILAAGSMSDRLGRKGMLLAGLGVFGAASLARSLATSTRELTGAGAVMGLGAAMMFPATLSLLTNVFTARRERAAAIGLWGATTGVGIATGPIIGGWLLEHYWWGSVSGEPRDLLVEMATDVVPPPFGDHANRIRTTVPCLPGHDIGQLADLVPGRAGNGESGGDRHEPRQDRSASGTPPRPGDRRP